MKKITKICNKKLTQYQKIKRDYDSALYAINSHDPYIEEAGKWIET